MEKNIDPTLKSIKEYMKLDANENFVIPEYQRGYSWTITQCDKLWQDIEAFIDSNASDPYFFGTIIVDCSESNKFNLIDGQQRTTTFLLLLKALLLIIIDKLKIISLDEESEALRAGLKAKRDSIMTVLYKAEAEEIPAMLKDSDNIKNILVVENKSINEQFPKEIQLILEADTFEVAERNVYKIGRKQKDKKYTNYFRNFKYFYGKLILKEETQLNVFAKTFLEKCQVIEIRSWQIEQAITMFNSLNSTGMPLADADIISAQLYSKSGTNKDTFNQKWKELIELTDNLHKCKIVDIDDILQQFMYINRAINKEYINGNSVDVSTPGLRRYFTDFKKDLLDKPLELCDNLLKIAKIWDKIKDFISVKLLLKCNENVKLFLSSYMYRYNDPEKIKQENIWNICECLLKLFTILELSDSGYSSTKFKTFLFRENVKLVDKNISIEEIKKDFYNHTKQNWEPSYIKDAITGYEKNLLVYIKEFLYTQKSEFYFDDNVNIEHIMPASGRNICTIRKDANITDIEEFNTIVNKLGNKILLEDDINKKIGRNWFASKKQNNIKDKAGYNNSKYTIALAMTNYTKNEWTKDDINAATQEAAEMISDYIFRIK